MKTWNERAQVGKKFVTRGRTITEGDFSLLHNLTWLLAELQTNKEYMKKESQFGERIMAGPAVLACTVGLTVGSGTWDAVFTPESGLKRVAMLGIENVKFYHPVQPGDTIKVTVEMLDVRPTSRNPKRAVMRARYTTSNQRGEPVMELIQVGMIELVE